MRVIPLMLAAWLVQLAAQPQNPYESARVAMETSIESQRASVRKQVQSVQAAGHSFFSVPWVGESAAPLPVSQVVEPQCDPVPPEQIGPLIDEISKREGLTPDLLRAVIEKESDFRPCAVSSKGAQGLMQLMPATAGEFGVTDPFDPKQNVGAGARFLRQLLDRYSGDLSLALGAYNAGPGRVDFFGGVPSIAETLKYVFDIQERLKPAEPLPHSIDSTGRD
jgi:soluble lytic murein transglycosylase-like protein